MTVDSSTDRKDVLQRYPNAVCRKGHFAANRFHVFPESYENGWTGRTIAAGKWIGTGLSADSAWSDAAMKCGSNS